MFDLLASLLAFFYELVPSFAGAITLLTLTVMLLLFPLTAKGTKSMLEMQKLHPEIKKLQAKHKDDRQKLNEEMMALYRAHKVNPLSGCLPLLLQMPVFLVLYRVIDGLTKSPPKYIGRGSDLYGALQETPGKMVSFGVDLAKSASDSHGSFIDGLPFYVLIVLVVATQYYQQRQINVRNPQAAANPQAQMLQRIMPGFFGIISLSIPAGVVLYLLVSALFRIGQQALIYRHSPRADLVGEVRPAKGTEARTEGGEPKVDDGKPVAGAKAPERARPSRPAKGTRKVKPTGKPHQPRRPGAQSAQVKRSRRGR